MRGRSERRALAVGDGPAPPRFAWGEVEQYAVGGGRSPALCNDF